MTCEACRTIPPVISSGYTPKGTYTQIADLKTYITGPPTATTGIIDIYDIFGLSNQTIQGADLLAARLNALVLVPDFFHGERADLAWFPPDTEEKKAALFGFINTKAAVAEKVGVLRRVAEEARVRFEGVRSWGAVGLCWGGKVTAQVSGPNSPFVATGQVHPGFMDVEEAKKLTVPHIVLASKDEPVEAVKGYDEVIAGNGIGGVVETYPTMWHGWMGARAQLETPEGLAEYQRGYNQLADFFEKYLESEAKI